MEVPCGAAGGGLEAFVLQLFFVFSFVEELACLERSSL